MRKDLNFMFFKNGVLVAEIEASSKMKAIYQLNEAGLRYNDTDLCIIYDVDAEKYETWYNLGSK